MNNKVEIVGVYFAQLFLLFSTFILGISIRMLI